MMRIGAKDDERCKLVPVDFIVIFIIGLALGLLIGIEL